MKTKTMILWDDEDPLPMGKQIEEAFNRVIEFCPELRAEAEKPSHRPPEQIAWRKLTNGEFEDSDLKLLRGYTATVSERVHKKYGGSTDDVALSILQAAQHVHDVVEAAWEYVFWRLK